MKRMWDNCSAHLEQLKSVLFYEDLTALVKVSHFFLLYAPPKNWFTLFVHEFLLKLNYLSILIKMRMRMNEEGKGKKLIKYTFLLMQKIESKTTLPKRHSNKAKIWVSNKTKFSNLLVKCWRRGGVARRNSNIFCISITSL